MRKRILTAGFFYIIFNLIPATASHKLKINVLPPDSLALTTTLADFTTAANISRPAVVHIKTYSKNLSANSLNPLEEFFKDFYGDKIEAPDSETNKEIKPQLSGAGSGVIISENGFIITNNHIAEGADRIEVVLNDKRSYNATMVGGDASTDIALLKIDANDLQSMEYGNSDGLKIGEWVLAVGNPFNLTSTVTAGIISAKGRNINILGGDNNSMAVESFIQTDAAVNPGNSGGALVDLHGRLIGINTAIASPTGAFAGYSFAVPVNIVKKIVSDLKEYKQVQRVVLGVMIRDLNADLAREKNISSLEGVYVESVNEGSSAEMAGLKKGDVIIEVEDLKVNTPSEIQEILATHMPGDYLKILYKRGSKQKDIKVQLKNKLGSTEIVRFDPNSFEGRIGADLIELNTSEQKRFKIAGGVKVLDIKSGKFKDAGIRDGFIITHIDKIRISSAKEARKKLEAVKNSGATLEGVYPDGQEAFYSVNF